MAALHISGAKIYDALILEVALAHAVPTLYTWNQKDFLQLAEGLPIQIATP